MRTITVYKNQPTEMTTQYYVIVADTSLGTPVMVQFKVDFDAVKTQENNYEKRTIKRMNFRVGEYLRVTGLGQPTEFHCLSSEEMSWLETAIQKELNSLILQGIKKVREAEVGTEDTRKTTWKPNKAIC